MLTEQILDRLEGVTGGAHGQWHARCPAHDDHQASLTVAIGDDGRTLLTCWTGCELVDVVRAIGLDVRDLFVSRDQQALTGAPWGDRSLGAAALPLEEQLNRMVQALLEDEAMRDLLWDRKGWRASVLAALGIGRIGNRVSLPVRDLSGRLVNHLRYRPDASTKMLATKGMPRSPLFLLDDTQDAQWAVEGETDAISLAMLGLSVIGAPGASAKARPEWLEPARGRPLFICFDLDAPGRRAAQRWAHVAKQIASEVRIVELDAPEGTDVGDVVREGRDDPTGVRRRLLRLAAATPVYVEHLARLAADDAPPPAPPPDDGPVGEIIATRGDTVRTERVRWLWHDRIPVGRIGIVFGPPGHGKSTFTALLSSEITNAGGRVLIASAEDNAATTIIPRLSAAGADLSRVELIETRASKGTTSLVLPRDLDAVGAFMRGRALLIIDPLSAHLGDDVNAWSEQSVRARVLAPLAWHANEHNCTVVLIMHVNKSDRGDALARISGSGGFGGAARFALLLGTHPDDIGIEDETAQRLAVVHVKASEGARQKTMVYRRRVVSFITDDAAEGIDEIAAIPVLDLVTDSADIESELVLAVTDPEERGSYSEAMIWLRRELSVGPQQAKRLLAQARERGDFSERTLRKAKRALRVRSERESDGWYWVLDPSKDAT